MTAGDTSAAGAAPRGSGRPGEAVLHRGLARSLTPADVYQLIWLGGVSIAGAGSGGLVAMSLSRNSLAHPVFGLTVSVVAALWGVALLLLSGRKSELLVRRLSEFCGAIFLGSPLLITGAQYAIGPITVVPVLLYVEVPILAYYLLSLRRTAALMTFVVGQFSLLVLLQPGYEQPGLVLLIFTSSLCLVVYMFGVLLNSGLEQAARNWRLARFLMPEIAEAVVSSRSALLEPHRAQIAVLFCDLRGFTRFAATSEPEDTVEVIREYMQAMGAEVHAAGATVGGYAGDGIMAYFNDPVPCDNPPRSAVQLAQRLSTTLDLLEATWIRRGFELSYGIGIAYGYATLGVFGYQGRQDYSAIGTVVNLAARLSDCAKPREILIDARAQELARSPGVAVRHLQLKGYPQPVQAFSLAAPNADSA